MVIVNHTDRLMLVFVEPLALDFWLQPGESAELVVEADAIRSDLELEITGRGVTVWLPREMEWLCARKGEVELPCGYQRPSEWPSRGDRDAV
jgi:hypothetical protein